MCDAEGRGRILPVPNDRVEIRTSPGRGRGVFTREPIAPGTLIEAAPVIILPAADCPARPYGYLRLLLSLGRRPRRGRSRRPGARPRHLVQPFQPSGCPRRSQSCPAHPRPYRDRSDRTRRGGYDRLRLHIMVQTAGLTSGADEHDQRMNRSVGAVESGEKARQEGLHSLRRRCSRWDEPTSVSRGNKGRDEVGVT